ncbi:MAG: TetR/AcrR family transcriptional regulator [Bacteroidales bacterium]|jgi:AcrR family transcriptional regulator
MPSEKILKKRKRQRAKIIEISGKIFASHGFKKTTMDEIAKAADMGKSSLYYYFKSKEEVFVAVIKAEAAVLAERLQEKVISRNISPIEKLKEYVHVRMAYLKEFANYYALLKSDYLSNLAFTEGLRKNIDKNEEATFQKILEEGVEKQVFQLTQPKFTAITIVNALKGLEHALILREEISEQQLQAHLDQTVNILFHGILKR